MNITHTHTLTTEDAKARMLALSEYIASKHGIMSDWNEDQTKGSIKGSYLVVTIDAAFEILEGKVVCNGKDPGMLWRKKANAYIKNKLETYLNPDTPLEDLPRS